MDNSKGKKIDPITMSVIFHRLEWINKEMGVTMLRTSKNPIFAEVHDFSCAICDWEPRLLSQVDGVPSHTASTMTAAKYVFEAFGKDVNDGDVFIINEPYIGGTHLADITVIKPIFYEGDLIFTSVNRAHHADVGGLTAGSYSPLATEIYHEGIRIPPLRIYKENGPLPDVLEFISLNTRLPSLIVSDIKSQVGSCTIAERRLRDLIDKYGVKTLKENVEAILDYAEKQMRAEIAKIPDGEYDAESELDNDGFQTDPVKICTKITINNEDLTVDFSGSDNQVKGFVNSPYANTVTSVYVGILTVVDPSVPHNQGAYRPISVKAPEGSVVNSLPPAPVADCTLDTACGIIEAVWKALAKALPNRVTAGWCRYCGPSISGIDPRNNEFYVQYSFCGMGGAGALPGMDGYSYLSDAADLGGMTFPNIESNEVQYPHITEIHEFRQDSGGSGKFRGGLGVKYKIKMYDEKPLLVMFGDGVLTPPYGLYGGKEGKTNKPILNEYMKNQRILPTKGVVQCSKGDTYTMYSAGGGGWGNPIERDIEKVRIDVINGFISLKSAENDYGVVLDALSFKIKEIKRNI
jgi:N-methylhydantoinase B